MNPRALSFLAPRLRRKAGPTAGLAALCLWLWTPSALGSPIADVPAPASLPGLSAPAAPVVAPAPVPPAAPAAPAPVALPEAVPAPSAAPTMAAPKVAVPALPPPPALPPVPETAALPAVEELVGPPSPLPSEPPPQGALVPGAEACEVPARPAIPVPDRPEVNAEINAFSGRHRRVIARGLERAGRYLPMIRKVFAEAGLPPELASLPLVESSYVVNALSRAGALGMWQFIASTARASQLRVDWWVDERLDPEASTRAAARHLKELYDQFGDWELALAAYNAGAGGVGRAMARSGRDDFWGLLKAKRLHSETRRYVPKFYAALEILLDPTEYGFDPLDEKGEYTYDVVDVDCQIDLYTVSKASGIPLSDLKELNPSLIRCVTPPGASTFPLKVPLGWGDVVRQALADLDPEDRYQYKKHKVSGNETLASIGKRYGIGPELLAELNRLPPGKGLKRGKELLIPYKKSAKPAPGQVARADVHVVEKGDTLWNVAGRYGITLAELKKWNGVGERQVLSVGRELRVAPPEAKPRVEASLSAPEEGGAKGGDGGRHVVAKGDTLWSVARRYGLTVDALRRLNGLAPNDTLSLGASLRLR